MTKTPLLILFSLMLGLEQSWAQEGYIKATFSSDRYGSDLTKQIKAFYLANYYQQLSQQCIGGSTYVSWYIDSAGNVKDIKFAEDMAPPLAEECIKKALLATNGEWQPAQTFGRKIRSRSFLLRVLYAFKGACKTGTFPKTYWHPKLSSERIVSAPQSPTKADTLNTNISPWEVCLFSDTTLSSMKH